MARVAGVSWTGGKGLDDMVLHCWVQDGLTSGDLLERLANLFGSGVFGQITSGAGAQGIDDRAVIGVGGEHEDLDVGVMLAKAAGAEYGISAGTGTDDLLMTIPDSDRSQRLHLPVLSFPHECPKTP